MDSEGPVLIDTGSGFTLKYKGKNLYSSIQPEERVCKRVRLLDIPGRTLVFVPSIGLGYGLHLLLEKCTPPAHILVVEVDEVLFDFACKQQQSVIPVHENLTIVRTQNNNELINLITRIGLWKFRRVIMCPLSGGIHLYKSLYDQMFGVLEKEIQQYWKNKITFIHMAPLWIKNIFINLAIINNATDISALQTDLPVVVAGAGPSLDASLPIIKAIRKQVIIIAVDTALPYFFQLREQGWKDLFPDYVFVLESQIANLNDFISCKNPGIPLIGDITSHPSVLRLFSEKKYLFSSRFADINLYDRMDTARLLPTEFPPLGSVGVAALYTALHITTGPVFVTGLDFGYTHHMTHCRSTTHHQYFESASSRLSPLESLIYSSIQARPLVRQKGKGETSVLTDIVLNSYAAQVPGIVGDRAGIYDIGPDGLDLGIPLADRDMACSLVGEQKRFRRLSYDRVSGYTLPDPGKIKAFLDNEKDYLIECRELITFLLRDGKEIKKEFSKQEKQTILRVDYTYLHFPDTIPLPVCHKNFLFRELISIEHYIALMDRVMKL